jgi:ketosteroid isomerase-like protein
MVHQNIERVLSYFGAVEAGAVGEALAGYFHPEVTQREYPNRLVPGGATRGLRELLEAAERGQRAVADQRYEVRSIVGDGDIVAAEISWSATLKVPLGKTPVGGTIRAEIGTFIRLRDGLIVEQTNYDCYPEF